MVGFFRVVFHIVNTFAIVALAGAIVAGLIAPRGEFEGAWSVAAGAFWTVTGSTIVLLLCEIVAALERLAPRPPPPRPQSERAFAPPADARPWAREPSTGPGM